MNDRRLEKEFIDKLCDWNNTTVPFPANTPIHYFISENAVKYCDKTAISYKEFKVSYRELNERSNQIAAFLISRNVKPGDKIALALDRSPEMVIVLVAIMKTGAAYIPVDPAYPKKRIEHMIADSSAKFVITSSAYRSQFSSKYTRELLIEDIVSQAANYPISDPEVVVKGNDLAYIIYTSGSTGNPKGIVIEHQSLTNFLVSMQKAPGITSADKLLAVTTISFDISGLELFLPLISGAELLIADTEISRDGKELFNMLGRNNVTIMQATPSTWRMMLETDWKNKLSIKALCGGEALPKDLAAELLNKCGELWNMYGPTETTIWSAIKHITNTEQPITIGRPINNTKIYILDSELNHVPHGETGDIYISGSGLAREYFNQPELTANSFIRHPFSDDEKSKIYRTGDLGKFMPDGEVLCLGRNDNQIKIRGNRVELGAIESALNSQQAIKESIVVLRGNNAAEHRLVAYIVPESNERPSSTEAVFTFNAGEISRWVQALRELLPGYMIPDELVGLKQLPLLPNGKIDRKRLPEPASNHTASNVLYKAPSTQTEKLLTGVWESVLKVAKIGVNDNFFELGGNSLLATRFVAILEQDHQRIIPLTRLYQYPFVEKIAAILDGKEKTTAVKKEKKIPSGGDIAIIGMSGRFPGANTIEQLWDVVKNGKETISFFTDDEIDKSIPESVRNDPQYVKARGIIDNADQFDAPFFGINPRIAEIMDPQQRIFLEISWEALESAGYVPDKFAGKIGVFAGSGSNSYYLNNIHTRPEVTNRAGYFQVSTLNDKDYLAMRIAYELNLTGPAISVYSSSSTSLLAIAQAVESLRQGQCDMALAGGVTINVPIKSGQIFEEGAMFSNDGHCRPFDASASGTVFSDGAGVVLLKPLKDAFSDGDPIYGVIKGIGINNDGGLKASFTAPHAEGQAEAIRMALQDAGVAPSGISYIEAHGTATPIGDPIEIEALNLAFGEGIQSQSCAIGSLKSNIGHLTHAAGVAGLIKTVLALHHKQLPPSLFYQQPNPNIDFKNSPFFVNTKFQDWKTASIRRAGVSSFGMGGTNVHVILEESPQQPISRKTSSKPRLICWSAKNEKSLEEYGKKLAAHLVRNPETQIADIAFTLQARSDFNVRKFIVAANTSELISKLSAVKNESDAKVLTEKITDIAFLFPGQGSQYLNMGKDIYNQEPVFRQAIDECADILNPFLGKDIRTILYGSDQAVSDQINNTRYTQPALFVTEYAMARLWMSWGIHPAALAGHSIGEFVAAQIAGIFSLEDVLKVVAERARLISNLPEGTMLAIKMSATELESLIPEGISIAAINSPNLCVVSGATEKISLFSNTMTAMRVACRLIKTSHAFHSSMMDGIKEAFSSVMKSVKLNPPRLPLVSTVTGKWMSESDATNPEYWTNQLRLPVKFADSISTLMVDEMRLFLEVGPGSALTIFARQHSKDRSLSFTPGFEDNNNKKSEYLHVLGSLGKLWQNGIIPDWQIVNEHTGRTIDLPTYAFNRKRYWIEPREQIFNVLESPVLEELIEQSPSLASAVNDLPSRKDILITKIKTLLENASGIEMENINPDLNFIEIGLDSLLLTQVALTLKKEFSIPVTFRQLNEDLNTTTKLADYLDQGLPQGVLLSGTKTNAVSNQISKKISELTKELELIQNSATIESISISTKNTLNLTPEEEQEINKPFGASPKIEKQSSTLTAAQTKFLDEFTEKYTRKTKGSKEYTQKHRAQMADPRVVSGFRVPTKELVYPIVARRSKGSKIWDIDGNEYIDALNGFGSNLLGYQPDILVNAIKEQMDKGYEIGPQHELAGDVCRLVCEFTQFDRAAICSTGSEAVMGTMRIARTVTGRSLIVAFSGSYHGIFDEVLIRGTKSFRSIPAAPGIMPEAVQNMLILDYGTEESLEIIRTRAHEFAAVLVEPVQSRRPEFQPVEFLKQVRKITESSGTALIFDEVITGFRMHPGGTQAMFGIKADIASYGKVIGGGLPVGVIAGKREFMDALDGGSWQFGDSSTPDVGVTYFAGTFVRHPLALAAAQASLEYFKSCGPALQEGLNKKGGILMNNLNTICEELRIPLHVVGFGSLWRFKFKEEIPYSELLFTLMRDKGIHILDGFPCFIKESHTLEELNAISKAFRDSAKELITAGFFLPALDKSNNFVNLETPNTAPIPGARLGRDRDGNPAWFVSDPQNPGKYLQVKQRNLE